MATGKQRQGRKATPKRAKAMTGGGKSRCTFTVAMHPEIKKTLLHLVADRLARVQDVHHALLCKALDRPELIDEGPIP